MNWILLLFQQEIQIASLDQTEFESYKKTHNTHRILTTHILDSIIILIHTTYPFFFF
jgi:hypothetical protein